MKNTIFYGYVDYTLDDGRPFYVGKGVTRRIKNPVRNKKHTAVSKKHGRQRIVEYASKNEKAVLDWEIATILLHATFESRSAGIGCNFTKGGEGVSGLSCSEKTRDTLRTKRMSRTAEERYAWASKRYTSHEELSETAKNCRTFENRSEAAKRMWAGRTEEFRKEISEKVSAARTAEERSASAKAWQAKKTPEQKTATAKKIVAAHTPEERSEIAKRREASYPKEVRDEKLRLVREARVVKRLLRSAND